MNILKVNPLKINRLKKSNPMNKSLKKKKDKIYIVGGGPSINISLLSKINDGDIMAVNKSIEYFNKVDFFLTMDYTFLKHKTDFKKVLSKSEKTIFVANKSNKYLVKRADGFYYDTRFNLRYDLIKNFSAVIESKFTLDAKTGFSLDYNGFANGENSGFSALQLAILMGYSEIYLLGFDLNSIGSKTHFHNGYKNNDHFRKNLRKFQIYFDSAFAKSPAHVKRKIISCSQNSYLNKHIRLIDFNHKFKNVIVNKSPKQKLISTLDDKDLKSKTTISGYKSSNYKDLIVVGYYTLNTPYELEKEKLVNSINKFGLASYIKGIPNLGDWQKNTRYKATFMLEVLEKYPNKKILYVDADAEILREPSLFLNYNCDIAIRWQDFRWRKNESLSGTIYIESNEKTKLLCKKWIEYNEKEVKLDPNVKSFEQWNLGKIIKEMASSHGLNHKNLPNTYCAFDHIQKIYPEIVGKEVILHYQASRRFKNKVKK